MLNWLRKTSPRIVENWRYFRDFDQGKPLRDYSFVVFDTELTGLDKRSSEIISIGAVKVENMQIDLGQSFSSYIQPLKKTHTDATLIHRITPGELASAPKMEEVVPQFIDFLGHSLLVGHCIAIDMDFIDRACRKLYGGTLKNPMVDTMRLSRSYYGQLYGLHRGHGSRKKSYNLRELSKNFQLPLFAQHSALDDAIQTAYLFMYLVKKFHAGGLETLNDLYRASRTGTWIDYV